MRNKIIIIIAIIIMIVVATVLVWKIAKLKDESSSKKEIISSVEEKDEGESRTREDKEEEEELEENTLSNGNFINGEFVISGGDSTFITNSIINETETGLYEIKKNDTIEEIEKADYIESMKYYKDYIYTLELNLNSDSRYSRKIAKIKPDGTERKVIVDIGEIHEPGSSMMQIYKDNIYYINEENKLETADLNGKNKEVISDEEEVSFFQVTETYIYYISKTEENFKRMNLDGTDVSKIASHFYSFQVYDKYAYYISRANHYLVRINLDNYLEEYVINDRVRTFNIVDGKIYYVKQDKEELAIYKVKIDGKNDEKIVDVKGLNNRINVADDWIYYTDNREDSVYYSSIYRIKINGKDKEEISF